MGKYAVCQDCGETMRKGRNCPFPHIVDNDGIVWQRVRYGYGEERQYIDTKSDDYKYCHDCNVSHGQYHHMGCDMETCPICSGQFITCGHLEEMDFITGNPVGKCPCCKKALIGHPAISRKDNKTEICSACGTIEALMEQGLTKKEANELSEKTKKAIEVIESFNPESQK